MGLENVFQEKVEKPAEEKKLKVIASVDAVVDDLKAHFEQNKYKGNKIEFSNYRKYLSDCINFLQNFKLTPEIIAGFNTRIGSVEEREALGVYLSALIQTSYNQGHNDFVFEDVNANYFGAFLKGQPKNPINIGGIKILKGYDILFVAENCTLTAETIKGNYTFFLSGDCSLTVETLEGNTSFWRANCCLAEITKYEGRDFGCDATECAIKSKNLETLKLIESEFEKGGNNKFKLLT